MKLSIFPHISLGWCPLHCPYSLWEVLCSCLLIDYCVARQFCWWPIYVCCNVSISPIELKSKPPDCFYRVMCVTSDL